MQEISPEEMEICLRVLKLAADNPAAVRGNDRFRGLLGKAFKEGKRADQQESKWRQQIEDRLAAGDNSNGADSARCYSAQVTASTAKHRGQTTQQARKLLYL